MTTTSAPPAQPLPVTSPRKAGIVTRFAAFLIDLATIAAIFAIAGQILEYLVTSFRGNRFTLADHEMLSRVAYILWGFVYCAYPLSVAGRTVGLAVLGLRVTRKSGGDLDGRHAVLRVLVFPLSFLVFGFGFLLIVLRRDRRALHDLIADTAVVYDRTSIGGRLHFLTRDGRV